MWKLDKLDFILTQIDFISNFKNELNTVLELRYLKSLMNYYIKESE